MFMGNFDKFKYYLSITNGNGKASDNLSENNNFKDLQFRLDYKVNDNILLGASLNLANEELQEIKLVDHTFESYNSARIQGKRTGILGHAEYQNNKILIRSEAFSYIFDNELSPDHQIASFVGGYGELGYFLFGNNIDGLQLIGRYEKALIDEYHPSLTGPTSLNTYLFGPNIYLDGIFRLQFNVVYEKANAASLLNERFENKDNNLQLLTMLQIKF
jgi:hypothetical protein